MPIDEFIINIYLMVEQYYKIVVTQPLRGAGYAPKLSDPEIICMEMVGEFLHLDQDKQIWQYFTQHWQDWFPAIGSYPNFAKHCANLWQVKQQIQDNVSQIEGRDNIHFMDGFPIPVCHYGRAYRHKNYQDLAAFSYCAAKQAELVAGSKLAQIYGSTYITERHRHRYEMNNRYIEPLEQAGMTISGYSAKQHLVESVEIPNHPWFIAVQFHPEFTSSPRGGHPLFNSFVKAARNYSDNK